MCGHALQELRIAAAKWCAHFSLRNGTQVTGADALLAVPFTPVPAPACKPAAHKTLAPLAQSPAFFFQPLAAGVNRAAGYLAFQENLRALDTELPDVDEEQAARQSKKARSAANWAELAPPGLMEAMVAPSVAGWVRQSVPLHSTRATRFRLLVQD